MAEKNVGKITQIIGAVLDIKFSEGKLPEINDAIKIATKDGGELTVEVSQHLGDDTVKCIAMGPTDGLVRGMEAVATGAPITVPVGENTLGRIFNVLGEPIDNKPAPEVTEHFPIHRKAPSFAEQATETEILETGIKVVDLLCPYQKGGKIGLFGGFSALPVSIFGFFACGVLVSPNMVTAAATALVLSFGILFLLRSIQTVGEKEALFTGALMLGVLPIIYPPTIVFALILPIVMITAPLNIRQTIIITTGYLLPVLGASYLNWYLGGEISGLAISIWEQLFAPSAIGIADVPVVVWIIVAVTIPLLLYGIAQGIYNRYAMLVPIRKSIQIAICMFIIGIAALLFVPGCGITIIPAIAAPATIIASFALDKMDSKWANWFYIAIVTLVVIHLIF